MTTYNTGNPVPSADARDRYDNSQTFDEVINGGLTYYTNRVGNNVLSLKGMADMFNAAQFERDGLFAADQGDRDLLFAAAQEFRANAFALAQSDRTDAFEASQSLRGEAFAALIAGSGWQSVGAYASGIIITSHSQTVEYEGQPYALKATVPASIEAPYVTTGNWATESANFKLVGDNSLRQDLADPVSPALGVSLIGRAVVSIANINDLMAQPASVRRADLACLMFEYASGTNLGGGTWRWSSADMSAAVASDPYHGLTAPPTSDPTGASGAWIRIYGGEMFADWFGVQYGQTVDATARLNAASSLIRAGRGLRVRGDVLVNGLWDISNLPPRWTVVVDGTIWAGPGDHLTLRMAGFICAFRAFAMEKLGGIREGIPYEMLSMFFGNVDMVYVDKFGEGAQHVGIHSRPNGVNGIAWTRINIQNINVAGVAALFTTRTDTPGKTNGYINENMINIGYMGGRKGIWFKEGPEQTGGPFGGNWVIKPGFEQITDPLDAALDMEFCQRNTISDWRFEGPGIKGLQIRENAKCSRNVYRGSHALTDTKIQFDGILATIDAEIITIDGGLVAVSARQLGNGSALSYSTGDAWNIVARGDSLEQRIREPSLGYPARMQAQTPDGDRGFFEFRTRNWYQSFPVGTTAADVAKGISLIDVSLGTAETVMSVNMPLALELSGRELLLHVSSKHATSNLTIRKSTGTISVNPLVITSAGLYSLAYRGDAWWVSKIGEPYAR